jgi:DNA-binding NarL/FixJ family response regulator
VKGYVLKDAAEEELARGVRAVADDQGYFSPEVAGLVASCVAVRRSARPRLSPRERSVVQLISEGLPPRSIATRLFVSAQTVKSHRTNAMRKLGVGTTADLIRYAMRHGLTPSDRTCE